jgi:cyanate permease
LYPTVWLVALPFVLGVAAFYSFLFWAPDFIHDTLHVSNAATGNISGASAVLAAAAMLATGVLCDRTGERCLSASAAALLTAIGYSGAALLPSPLGRVACIVLVNVGVMSFTVAFWSVSSRLLRGVAGAAGIALVNSLGNVGGLVGPYMIGLVKDSTGSTSAAFLLLAATSFVAAALFVAYRKWAAFASPGGRRVAIGSPPGSFASRALS